MLPNFLVAGVAKAGTTSLSYYLQEHPAVSIPKKETFYFIRDFYSVQPDDVSGRRDSNRLLLTEEKYNALYAPVSSHMTGEISTCYFHFHQRAYPEIRAKLGDIPVLVVLRNPVERALSGYNYHRSLKTETTSFEDALLLEHNRREAHWDFMWYYTALGFYHDAAVATLNKFSRVKFLLYDDLNANPDAFMKDVFHFLELTDVKINTSVKYNISDAQDNHPFFRHVVSNETVKKMLRPLVNVLISDSRKMKMVHSMRKANNLQKPGMLPETKEMLLQLYSEDIYKLQGLLRRDLSSWMK